MSEDRQTDIALKCFFFIEYTLHYFGMHFALLGKIKLICYDFWIKGNSLTKIPSGVLSFLCFLFL